jgi:beta-galactosidase
MHVRRIVLALVAATLTLGSDAIFAASPSQSTPRTIQQFTAGWRFLQANPAGAQQPDFDDAAWRPVTLPHDWAITGPVDQNAPSRAAGGFFPAGIGWYRKAFTVPASDAAPKAPRRTFIVFDGVMANSDVYLNGELLGHRPYGYVSFVYELTPHLRTGKNIVAVRVDDSQQPASRWYPGAGINRQVRLVTTGDTHIVPWGTFVTTPSVSAQSATVHVRSTAINESAAQAALSLQVRVLGPNGAAVLKPIASAAPISLAPGATGDLEAETTLPSPDRWDLNHGTLYKVQATLLRNGKPVDSEIVPFGIREFHFDADQGFFLNGVHHKIFGTAVHTDGGAVGTAVPLGVWERRLRELRKLGVNAIRTAHNPPAPEFLDLADRMGFLVMEEMFDCWTVAKNPYDYHLYFKEWSLRDTADTVMRDRNHPSIILWSAGNEIHDTPKPDIAIPILKSLVDTFHKYDPARPVTQALFRPNASHDYDDGLADLLDVVGQNYREQEILAAHAQKPTRKIVGTENTHDRNQWVAMRDHPEYSGQFLWSGIDYLGEAGQWPSIGSGSGLLLSNALARPRALERQSWWSSTPMVAIVRRVTAQRTAPVDPGYANAITMDQSAAPAAPRPGGAAGRPTAAPLDPSVRFYQPLLADWTPKSLDPHTENVEVYTNAQEVELFLNGKSLGTEKLHTDASPITYQVPFAAGELKAVARNEGKVVVSSVLKTAGKPARIVLSADSPDQPLTPDWNDVRCVTATLVDASGTRIPDSATLVHFSASGPASVIAVDSGNMVDHEPLQAAQRKLYDGNVTALLRATGSAGKVTITAAADGVAPGIITLEAGPLVREDRNIAHPAAEERGF